MTSMEDCHEFSNCCSSVAWRCRRWNEYWCRCCRYGCHEDLSDSANVLDGRNGLYCCIRYPLVMGHIGYMMIWHIRMPVYVSMYFGYFWISLVPVAVP